MTPESPTFRYREYVKRIRFNELKARCKDLDSKVTNDEISLVTGINIGAIEKIASGRFEMVNAKYVDALYTYFKQRLPDLKVEDFIMLRSIHLPISVESRGIKRKGQANQ